MKIVIDLPEKVIAAIQNGEDYRYDIHTAIAQGIPYTENDLYREETCDRKSHCIDYEYWHCIGCNGCKRREAEK